MKSSTSSQARVFLLPDGVEHPLFRKSTSGRGSYILCWKDALNELTHRGQHKRIHFKAEVHSLLISQVDHLLRIRILQELELLAERIQNKRQGAGAAPIIRRLTRDEWIALKTVNVLPPDSSSIAVLVVPAVQKSRFDSPSASIAQSQTLDEALAEPSPDSPSSSLPPPNPPSHREHPIATLRPMPNMWSQDPGASPPESSLPASEPSLSPHLIPIYNGISLFPDAAQRATLHARLQDLLHSERDSRWSEGLPQTNSNLERNDRREMKEKTSDAYLIRSDALTLARADTVPFAIACWRLRMWEGEGWRTSTPMGDPNGTVPELREGGWAIESERGAGFLRRVRGRTIPKVARDG
ncbi:hypothetical protein BS47DRAFT_1348673 [Hydnum rufescens UP504]|uniref:Uncharacterized protein n=1 Tax=Hydnum rufescens UP504 TaxID=1448309 RepID=A0A9P6DSU5_9AGAM|nr:hypothetical protein BS47DRAFT_1348673 [Hydnum rufescens UP504]